MYRIPTLKFQQMAKIQSFLIQQLSVAVTVVLKTELVRVADPVAEVELTAELVALA